MEFKGYAEVNVTDADRAKLQAFSKYLDDLYSVMINYVKNCDKEQFSRIEKVLFRSRKFYDYELAYKHFKKALVGIKVPAHFYKLWYITGTYENFDIEDFEVHSHLKEPLRKLKSLFESDKVFLSDDLHEAWWEIKDSDWTPINELVEHLEGQV